MSDTGVWVVVHVRGTVDKRFTRLKEAFEENFLLHGEIGASISLWLDGKERVHLWGGLADVESNRAWTPETLGMVFSVTKGLTSMTLLRLQQQGLLDYDEPIGKIWPEFACNGKEDITIRQLLNHRAGLCAIDEPLTLADVLEWKPVVKAMEAQEPLWTPGEQQGYGSVAMGAYAAEIARRVSGKSVGTILREQVAGPLEARVFLGLPEEQLPHAATIYPTTRKDFITGVVPRFFMDKGPDGSLYRAIIQKKSMTRRSISNPSELGVKGLRNYNKPMVRTAELPWVNAFVSASGLAKIYGAMAQGGTLGSASIFEQGVLKPLESRQSWSERDNVVLKPLGFSQGFVKDLPNLFSPNLETYGHPGAGGSVGFADPVAGVGFSYVMNKMDFRIRSPRCLRLCKVLYECLNEA